MYSSSPTENIYYTYIYNYHRELIFYDSKWANISYDLLRLIINCLEQSGEPNAHKTLRCVNRYWRSILSPHLTCLRPLYFQKNDISKVLSKLPSIEMLDLSRETLPSGMMESTPSIVHDSSEFIGSVKNLKSIKKLDLSYNDPLSLFPDLSEISHFSSLTWLNLFACKSVTDQAILKISAMESLRYLELGNTKISGWGPFGLTGMKHLTHLGFRSCINKEKNSFVCIASLFQKLSCLDLESLNISKCPGLDTDDIIMLSRFKKLKNLDLSYNILHNLNLESLANLVKLNLSASKLGSSLETISLPLSLTDLDISNMRLSDESLISLGGLTNLVILNIEGSPRLSGIGLESFAKLKYLTCSNCKISNFPEAIVENILKLHYSCSFILDTILQQIGRFKNITDLDLTSSIQYGTSLLFLCELKNLKFLRIGLNRGIGSRDISHFLSYSASKELELLDLCGTQIGDSEILLLTGFPKLKHLSVAQCFKLTESGIMSIKKFTNLTSLNLAGCKSASDSITVFVALTNLEKLDISCCLKISKYSLQLLAKFTKLREVNCQGTNIELQLQKKLLVLDNGLENLAITISECRHLYTK